MRYGVSLFADRRSCTQIKPYNRAHGIQLRNIMGDQEHCPSSAAPACVRHHGFFGLPVSPTAAKASSVSLRPRVGLIRRIFADGSRLSQSRSS